MAIPILPESAPFSSTQRSWLNGFFAGMMGLDESNMAPARNATTLAPVPAPVEAEEDFPWHDPALPMAERLQLAEGKPHERVLMAAMAQLDCGACGYLCKSYSEAIARGEETDLTKCSPGGKDTAKKLKELVAGRKSLPTVEANGHHHANDTLNGTAKAHASPASATVAHDRKNPFPAPLLFCQPLTNLGSEKDVRHVAFSLKGSGLNYEVGDALGLMPENDPELVEAVLNAMGARGDELVPIPGGSLVHAYDALAKSYVITKVSDAVATLLANSASDPSEAGTLKTLVNDDVEGIPAGWDVLDLLEQFPSARASLPEMIGALAPLQPRLYSISSSLKMHPEEVHLTIGVVRYTQAGRLRKGVASNFVTETLRTRQKAGVFVHTSPGFRLPTDTSVPIIMVGPGTGIAPFRAFLEERQATGATGKNWLFFGDQRQEFDFLFRDEIVNFQRNSILTRLDTAFSRDQKEKVYVQHRMIENAKLIWDWLESGAHFYVCGDARRMALDVDLALHTIVAEQGGLSPDAAKAYIKSMSQAKRYQRDVY